MNKRVVYRYIELQKDATETNLKLLKFLETE